MDVVFNVLLALSLLGVAAYALAVYATLKIAFTWAKARWQDDWGRPPLLLKLPPRALSAVLALAFLAVVL